MFNCQNKKQNSALTEITENADSLNFEKFIKDFSADENFQFEHIKFPLEMFLPENELAAIEKDTTIFINKKDWKFLNLANSSKYPTAEKVIFKTMQSENGFAIVVQGYDCGILITYFFEKQREEDTWFLVKMEDSST